MFNLCSLIGGLLLDSVVMVFAIHQHEFATSIRVSPHPEPLLTSLLTLSLWVVPGHLLWVSCLMHWTCIGHLFYIWWWVLSHSVVSNSFDPMDCSAPGSSVQGDSPGKNTGVGCHALLQGIFPTQRLNSGLLHCRWILYHLSHQGSPYIWCCTCFYAIFSNHPTLAFSHWVQKSVLYICVSFAALHVGLLLPSFKIPHMYVNIQYLSFSFWVTSLCIIGSRFIRLIRTDSNVFLFIAE